jgi:hypothetical protein
VKSNVKEHIHAAELRDRLAPVVEQATQAAQAARGHADQARTWVTPRVGAAAERVSPTLDAARDRLVDDLLPRIVEAVTAAAAATAAATTAARDASVDKADSVAGNVERAVDEVTGAAEASRHRRRRRNWILLFAAFLAAAVAAAAALKRSGSSEASWESAPGDLPATGSTGTPSTGAQPADPAAPVTPVFGVPLGEGVDSAKTEGASDESGGDATDRSGRHAP